MDQRAHSIERTWRFVRGDASGSEFRTCLSDANGFRAALGEAAFELAVSTNFSDSKSVETLREALANHLRTLPGPGCFCIRLCDEDVVDMGSFNANEPAFEERPGNWSSDDVMGTLETKAERSLNLHTVEARVCRACGQRWLVGVDRIQNDLYCLHRLPKEQLDSILNSGQWPPDFETFESILQMGTDAFRRAQFLSVEDSFLYQSTVELARARPGIPLWKIADLLNLGLPVALELSRRAMKEAQVDIEGVPGIE